ncbi:SDR family oxidoreductase [Spirosoma arcticum]
MNKKAFVTGGTGFLGINLIERLVTDGWDVTALCRPTSDTTYLKRFPIQIAEGSIEHKASLEKTMPMNLDAVFHIAGDTNIWKKNNVRQRQTNVDGTRYMVEVALQKRAACFIHTSSISAWGPVRVPGLINEETPQQGGTSFVNYEKTKWAGEHEVLKAAQQGMKVVVLNPGSVVGPYDKNTWGRSFFLIQKGELPFVPSGGTCFVHVHEVVKAHIAAVERGQIGHNYILGGINGSFPEFFNEIARLLGKKPPLVASPSVFKLVGGLMGAIGSLTNKEPVITPELAEMSSRKGFHFSSEKAKRELGLQDIPISTCIADNYRWLVQERLLP